MGILSGPLKFIKDLDLRPGFTVCELGDQWITHGTPHRLAKSFYLDDLSASEYVSIDGNGRGTFTHDLNFPLPKKFGQFNLVTDFGTGEHIFNQAQVWKTIHYLTKLNGYIVFDRPTQGYAGGGGHCYYNSHECLFNDIAAANEYEVLKLEHHTTSRGELIRGVFRRMNKNKFQVPQQGRYKKLLRLITTPKE